MPVPIATAAAIYFTIWWIVLFAVLPWGIKPQGDADVIAGTDPGAPAAPRLLVKALCTTAIAAVVLVVVLATIAVMD